MATKEHPTPKGLSASMASLRSDHSGSEATKDKQLSFANASHLRLPELSSESVATPENFYWLSLILFMTEGRFEPLYQRFFLFGTQPRLRMHHGIDRRGHLSISQLFDNTILSR